MYRLALWMMVTAFVVASQGSAPEWTRADAETVRVSPTRFPDLPPAVRTELVRRGCTIPQPFTARTAQPVNVIRGGFIAPAGRDWAVLCSRQRRSSILVFRGGAVTTVDELGQGEDVRWLQVTGPGRIGYSRGIGVANPRYIMEHHASSASPLPALDHDAIIDEFIEKGSVFWYWEGHRWLRLAGADVPTRPFHAGMEPARD